MDDISGVERGRIRLVAGGAALALMLITGTRLRAEAGTLPEVTVYKNPT